jgi:hypothetical protein
MRQGGRDLFCLPPAVANPKNSLDSRKNAFSVVQKRQNRSFDTFSVVRKRQNCSFATFSVVRKCFFERFGGFSLINM